MLLIKKLTIFFICSCLFIIEAVAQTFEIRAVNKGAGVIGVEMRITSGAPLTASDNVTDIVFGLKWSSTYNVDLVSGITTAYNIKKSDIRKLKGSFHYQAFFADNIPYKFSAGWTLNNWTEIMSINNTLTGTGVGDFFITETGFDVTTDPNLGVNLADYTPVINGFASNVILPVALLSFSVTPGKNSMLVKWQTSDEVNNKGFELQRSERENGNFSPIGWINGKAAVSTHDYEFRDDKVEFNKEYFYRLKQVDIDGKETFSAVRRARLAADNNFNLTPNPAQNVITLSVPLRFNNAKCTIKISDAKGAIVYQREELVSNTKEITLTTFSGGTYFLSIESNGSTIFTQNFMKL